MAISSIAFTAPAQAFSAGDAISIIDAVGGIAETMTRPAPMPIAQPSRMNDYDDYDMECRFRGFDGWYDGKCQDYREDWCPYADPRKRPSGCVLCDVSSYWHHIRGPSAAIGG